MEEAGYIILNLSFHEESGRWLGECLELGTATFGYTLQEAKDNLEESILLHLNTLEDVGERERFFTEHNIRSYHLKPHLRSFTVPISPSRNVFIHPHIQRIPTAIGV